VTTPREEQVREFLRLLEAGDISLDYSPRQLIAAGALQDGIVAPIAVVLVASAPPPAATLESQLDDVSRRTLIGATLKDGVLDAPDLTFHAAVGDRPVVGAAIVMSGLVLGYIPFPGPLTLNGSDITVNWHEDGIFKL
jgi:hypothetical protein